jgi:NADH:ubiquinone oxidoreductase subunit H
MVLADIELGQLIWTTIFLLMLAAIAWVFIVVVRDLSATVSCRDGPKPVGWSGLSSSHCSDRFSKATGAPDDPT